MSGKSTSDKLILKDDNRLVSPFLIEEQNEGLLYYSSKKKNILVKIVAFALIIFFVTNSLLSILDPLNIYF